MKDKEARRRLDDIQDQLRVRWCETCKLYTLQHLTAKTRTHAGGILPEFAIAIPQEIGRMHLCGDDYSVWFCLHCNNITG